MCAIGHTSCQAQLWAHSLHEVTTNKHTHATRRCSFLIVPATLCTLSARWQCKHGTEPHAVLLMCSGARYIHRCPLDGSLMAFGEWQRCHIQGEA